MERHLPLNGFLCLCVDLYHHVWSCMGSCAHVCSCMVIYGQVWICCNNYCYGTRVVGSLMTLFSIKKTKTRISSFNVKTNCFMWNKKLIRLKAYCMDNVCWANEVQLMKYLNIWSTLLNINTIRIKEMTKIRPKQYQHH